MKNSIGFYLRILYWYKYRATYILLKQTYLALEKYTFKQQQVQATKYFEVQAQSMTSCCCKYNALYNLLFRAIFKLCFIDAIDWKFVYLFLLASLEQ